MSLTNLQTFVLITSLMGCLMSLVLFFLRKSYPQSIKGLDDWTVFPLLTALSSILYSTQGRWHHLLSMALPNIIVVVTLLIQLRGTYNHFGRRINPGLFQGVFLFSLFFILWTSGKNDYFLHRLVFISGLTTMTLVLQIPLLWKHRTGSFATHFMLFTILVIGTVMVARVVTALIDPPPIGIYTYSPIQAIYLATYSFGVLLLGISAILLGSEQLRKELEKLLKFDALTGALTRRAAFEYGASEFTRSTRLGAGFSVLMVDVDHFKKINDQFGHQVGDTVLNGLVGCIEPVLRSPGAVGRYGGEEFIVLLPDTDAAQAMQIAARIQTRIQEAPLAKKITLSIGAASFTGSQHDSFEAMVGRADAALYQAKNNGRNQIVADTSQA